MITKIEIDGFKSFKNFSMEFTPFTVIAGINASGKSNLFDALELLSRLSTMSLRDAFPETRGNVNEVFTMIENSKYLSKMSFGVEMLVDRNVKDIWGLEEEIKSPRLRYEIVIERIKNSHGLDELTVSHESLLKIPLVDDNWSKTFVPKEYIDLWKSKQKGGTINPFIETKIVDNKKMIYLRQDGRQGGKAFVANTFSQSLFGTVNSVDYPHVLAAKIEMSKWRFMQLSPEELRKPSRKSSKMIDEVSFNGANLAATLHRLKLEDEYVLTEISRQLIKILPEYVGIDVEDDEFSNILIIKLKHKDGKEFSSRLLSEGTLRLIALLIMQYDERHSGLLCFEEPENGIHPQLIKQVTHLLHDLSVDFKDGFAPLRQVIINTHSPILVRELLKWQNDNGVSVWLSKMNTLIAEIDGKKYKLRTTKMSPVKIDNQNNIAKSISQMSVADLEEYLNTLKDESDNIE